MIEDPKRTHIQIEGKQTNGAVPATNAVATIKFSSLGKNAVAAVSATTHALGLINWKSAASYNFNGLPVSLSLSENEPNIFDPKYNK